MTYKEAIKQFIPFLKKVTHIPKKEVEILLLHIIKKNIIWLYLNDDKECLCFDELEKLVKLRATYYPIEYILEEVTFFGERFFIEEGVLIPRPETEILVEKVIKKFKGKNGLNILEIGVGSGVISIILAKELDCKILAVDINKKAIKLAKKNIEKFNLQNKIDLIESNLFNNIDKKYKFDLLVSNPPYIKEDFKVDKNIYFEPRNALFCKDDGSEILKSIVNGFLDRDIKYIACEMGYNHRAIMENFFKKLNINNIKFYKDYAGFDRGFLNF